MVLEFFGISLTIKSLRTLAREADATIAHAEKYNVKIQQLKDRIKGNDAITLALIASKLEQKITSAKTPENPSPSLVQVLRQASGLDQEFVSPQGATPEQNAQRWQDLTKNIAEKCYQLHADPLMLDSGLARRLGVDAFEHVLRFMFRHVDDLTLWAIAKKMDRVQTPDSSHQKTVNALLNAEAKTRLWAVRQKIHQAYTLPGRQPWPVGFHNLCGTLYGNCDRKRHSNKNLLEQKTSEILDWVYGFGLITDPYQPLEFQPPVNYADAQRVELQQTARNNLKVWIGVQIEARWYGNHPLRFTDKMLPIPPQPKGLLAGLRGLFDWALLTHIR